MLAGLLVVFHKLWVYHEELGPKFGDPAVWLIVALFSIVYGLSEIFLARGWFLLLRAQGVSGTVLSWKEAWPVYGKTQIAKYIPGNVFHIAGRHAVAHEKGAAHSSLLTAAILEVFLMIASAGLISLFAAGGILRILEIPLSPLVIIVASCAILLMALVTFRSRISKKFENIRWLLLVTSQLAYIAFFTGSCVLFLLTLAFASNSISDTLKSWPLICGAYCFSWAAGFIMPGAPGGLGIREAMLIALLGAVSPESVLVFAMIVFRMINISGDLVFYGSALIAEKIYRKSIAYIS